TVLANIHGRAPEGPRGNAGEAPLAPARPEPAAPRAGNPPSTAAREGGRGAGALAGPLRSIGSRVKMRPGAGGQHEEGDSGGVAECTTEVGETNPVARTNVCPSAQAS